MIIGPTTKKVILGTIVMIVPFAGLSICGYLLCRGLYRSYTRNKETKGFYARMNDLASETQQEIKLWKSS